MIMYNIYILFDSSNLSPLTQPWGPEGGRIGATGMSAASHVFPATLRNERSGMISWHIWNIWNIWNIKYGSDFP